MENEIGKEKMVFSILVGRLAAARRWTGGGEVSGRSIGGEGWRHQARLGRWASLWEWGNGGVAETAQGGDICRRQGGAVVAGGGPCIILESKEGGGGEMAAQVEGNRAVAALTREEEGGDTFARFR
jgi:hypothetical protein